MKVKFTWYYKDITGFLIEENVDPKRPLEFYAAAAHEHIRETYGFEPEKMQMEVIEKCQH